MVRQQAITREPLLPQLKAKRKHLELIAIILTLIIIAQQRRQIQVQAINDRKIWYLYVLPHYKQLKRIAYTSESGTNFLNLQRQHSFLSFPIRRLPLKPSIGSLISSNHFDILTSQIRNSSKRDVSPQNHHNHQLNSSGSSDEQLIFADDPFSKHVLLNCNTCNTSNNYNADCIMCKFKNKFNGYNLSKNGKRRVKKIEKIDIDKIKSSAKSKTKSATVSVESAQPFPHLQKSLLQERIPQFYDKDLLEDTGEMSFINNEISRSADKDELIVLEQNLDDIENDEDVIPKLTLWLV